MVNCVHTDTFYFEWSKHVWNTTRSEGCHATAEERVLFAYACICSHNLFIVTPCSRSAHHFMETKSIQCPEPCVSGKNVNRKKCTCWSSRFHWICYIFHQWNRKYEKTMPSARLHHWVKYVQHMWAQSRSLRLDNVLFCFAEQLMAVFVFLWWHARITQANSATKTHTHTHVHLQATRMLTALTHEKRQRTAPTTCGKKTPIQRTKHTHRHTNIQTLTYCAHLNVERGTFVLHVSFYSAGQAERFLRHGSFAHGRHRMASVCASMRGGKDLGTFNRNMHVTLEPARACVCVCFHVCYIPMCVCGALCIFMLVVPQSIDCAVVLWH